MSRSLRRGALAAVLAVTIAPLAAACGTGGDPQTLEVKPDSVATSVGDVEILNAYIVTEPKGGGPAAITARVFNNGTTAQQLTGITVQGASAQVVITAADGKAGPLTIPAGASVTLGGKGNPSAELSSDQGVVPGNFQNTVFDFSRTGQVSLAPSVVPATQYFTSYAPTVSPTPSVSASTPGSPSGSPSGAASGSPSASTTPAGNAGATGKPVASTTPKS